MSQSISFSELLEQNMQQLTVSSGDIVRGTVEEINNKYVIINAGLKSESFIDKNEFLDASGELTIAVGDQVDVAVESIDDGCGYTALSYEKAKRIVAWGELQNSLDNDEVIDGEVMERVKGGFTVMVKGIKAFLPGSLADMRPIRDPGQLENQTLQFKVVKMDPKRNNIVVSRRAVIESETSEERAQLLASLQEGMEVDGIIKNLTDYGAFVDLGGIDGLLHITDMAWKRVKHPSEIVEVGQDVRVKVLSFDQERQRVSLGLKQMIDDPWHSLTARYPEGAKLTGTVTNITDYGCFVEVESGVEGLVHMSEMDWTNRNIHPSSIVKMGQEVDVMILEIDEKRRRISLGIKQCSPNPWSQFEQVHKAGDQVSGVIKSITDFGLFIGLPGGIDGLIHHSDLSWNEPGEKVIRNYKKGEDVSAVILSIDAERERVSLGIKQLAGDKLGDFLAKYSEGSEVKATLQSRDDKSAIFLLEDDVQGQMRASDVPADVNEGDELTLYVAPEERRGSMIALLSAPAKQIRGPKASGADTSLGSLIKEQLKGKDA